MARLSILSNDEINALYSIPKLSNQERHCFFELDDDDIGYLDESDTIEQKVNYILQLGYYRAVSYFFKFSFQETKEAVEFILGYYFPDAPFPKKRLSKHYCYQNRRKVCKKSGLVDVDEKLLLQLEKEAKRLAKIHILPKFVLTGLLSFCQQKQIIKPAYSTFQEIVSTALKSEQSRLGKNFIRALTN